MAVVGPLGGLAFWVQTGVDLHLLMYPEARTSVERVVGRSRALAVRPLVRPEFLDPPLLRAEARAAVGVPEDDPLVVVSGGGWGAGDVAAAVSACLARPDVQVVVVAGRNEALRAELQGRYGRHSRVSVLGYTERMRDLLCAADALVSATAGISAIEARLCGCALLCYGFPVGHVRDNTHALAAHGLALVASSPAQLESQLRTALAAPRPPVPALADLSDPAEAVVGLARLKPSYSAALTG